ncbi:hypothetical protein BASA83_010723 [Batrachochytrium salamandrivorans]|nr:hypothetical protein BASA83_010723 [Batrachochytrium salamandrivorans]
MGPSRGHGLKSLQPDKKWNAGLMLLLASPPKKTLSKDMLPQMSLGCLQVSVEAPTDTAIGFPSTMCFPKPKAAALSSRWDDDSDDDDSHDKAQVGHLSTERQGPPPYGSRIGFVPRPCRILAMAAHFLKSIWCNSL